MRRFVLAILLALVFARDCRSSLALQCKGEKNQDVDWFLLYKLPRLPKSNNNLVKEGVAYLYMDSSSYKSGWTLSSKDISKNNSIPAYTMAQFYADKTAKDSLWILYNDQPPNLPARLTNGHAKGAVITDGKEGFWLIHSVPNFPPRPNTGEDVSRSKIGRVGPRVDVKDQPSGGYSYPSSGRVNGQSFLCVSTSAENFNSIGKQLMYNQIIVYRRNIPKQLIGKFTTLVDAAKQVRVRSPPYYRMASFYSKNAMKFTSFAKGSKWDRDLYDDFVAVELNTDLYAETWLNGRGKLPSDCNATRVMNVQSISLPRARVSFKSTHDHSKWAVSIDGKSARSWVCVGDINRADTQFERGGGTVCLNLPEVWKSYRDSVDDVEPCPINKKKGILERIGSWFG